MRFRSFVPALCLVALVPGVADAMGSRAKEVPSASAPASSGRAAASLAEKPSGYGLDDYLGRAARHPNAPVAPAVSRKVSRSGYGIDELP